MERNKFEVKLPDDEFIQEQISVIVAKGLPKRKTFLETLHEIRLNMPLWHVLFGRGEWLFSLLLLFGLLLLTVLSIGEQPMKETAFYSLLFTGAPFVFLALTGFSYLDRKVNGTLEIEMTTKFTVYQMLAIRMLVYSMIASFSLITCILVAAQFIDINVLYSIPVGLSGLFVFAALFLLLYRERHLPIRTGVYCMIWIGGNTGLSYGFLDSYGYLLLKLPIIIYLILLLSAISLFVYALKRFFTREQGGAFECLS